MKNTIEFPVEFGHTDAASIVFYPNYFRWFDAGTWHLLIKAGLTLEFMRETYRSPGLLPAGASSRFYSPLRFGDTVQLTTFVQAWHEKRMEMAHRIHRDGELCAEGTEVRVLGLPSPEDPMRFQAAVIPEELKQRLPAEPGDQ